jgi:hypothetical protein
MTGNITVQWNAGDSGEALLDVLRRTIHEWYRGDVDAALGNPPSGSATQKAAVDLLLAHITQLLTGANWQRSDVSRRLQGLGLMPTADPESEVAAAQANLAEANQRLKRAYEAVAAKRAAEAGGNTEGEVSE